MENGENTFVYGGKPVDLSAKTARLDFQSPLEVTFVVFAIISGIATIPLIFVPIPKYWALVPLSICIFSIFLYKNTDCTYLIDNMRKCIDYSRTFFGSETKYTVCRFDEVHCVTVNGQYVKTKHSSWWAYGVILVTTKGKVIQVSDNEREALGKANANAKALATHLDAQYQPGQLQRNVKVTYDPGHAQVNVEYVPHQIPWKILVIAIVAGLVLPLLISGVIILFVN